ncbi:DUF4831 family protein [Dysgonomonas sp. 216]|uniref:DUF4831 family protein n=1 Tax=Dysgonomonas sp. 216 TaxID=2302934 RepID=UPI0013D85105|nr:DUF4831 family protein [Dysgonomonas sp. 216]NDW18531.1 DUF4831 family protein [Dysgonomonas sp. 216]
MRYYIGLILLSFALQASAQNIVKMSAVKANDFGVAYSLPKTKIEVTAVYTKKTRKAGEFYQYAERYLNVSNPITENHTVFTIETITAQTKGTPDKSRSYLVEFKSNTVGAFVSLTEDGLICAINEDATLQSVAKREALPASTGLGTDPKAFLSEEILRAGSTAKQAELIAKQIYRLRDSRTNILTGEADNMPPDGNAYKLMMQQIDEQEKALTSMFVGTEVVEYGEKTFEIISDDKSIDKRILFRFSSKLGIVDSDDLSGVPVYLSLTNKNPKEDVTLSDKEQKAMTEKFSKGIIYNVPAKADLSIEFNNQVLLKSECDVVQFGTQDVISPKQLEYKKDSPIKIVFYPELGAIKQISQ